MNHRELTEKIYPDLRRKLIDWLASAVHPGGTRPLDQLEKSAIDLINHLVTTIYRGQHPPARTIDEAASNLSKLCGGISEMLSRDAREMVSGDTAQLEFAGSAMNAFVSSLPLQRNP